MEIENWSMIKYTNEELEGLTKELINIRDTAPSNLKGELVSTITIDGKKVDVNVDELTSVILRHTPIRLNLLNLYTIIHRVKLDQIPLYINTYPEVASWRLKIRK